MYTNSEKYCLPGYQRWNGQIIILMYLTSLFLDFSLYTNTDEYCSPGSQRWTDQIIICEDDGYDHYDGDDN